MAVGYVVNGSITSIDSFFIVWLISTKKVLF